MTIALYARRKQWPLDGVVVRLEHSRIHAVDCAECETKEGMLDRIDRVLVLAGLSVAGESLDYLAGALGARKFGGSRWAQAGAWAGGIVGFFFGLPGLLLGPVIGAATAELLRQRALEPSVKVGLGTLLGVVTGIAVKF